MKYKVNDNFFEKIDTESKAYFLGLMFADGCVQSNGKSWRIRIGLHVQDEMILKQFKNELNFKGVLYKTEIRRTLQISSKKMGNDLILHGCVPRKSLILEYPNSIPDNLINHFIRGYFDGDGCLCISGRGARLTMLGTEHFVSNVSDRIRKIGVNSTVFKVKNGNIFTISISGNRQIKILLEWLYKDSKFYMQRKKEKKKEFEELLKSIKPMKCRITGTIPEKSVVSDYLDGTMIADIEKKYKITNVTMYKILRKNNVALRQKRKGVRQ